MNKVLICAGGKVTSNTISEKIPEDTINIGVDGGIQHLLDFEKKVHYCIGDFDTFDESKLLNDDRLKDALILKHPPIKDATDLELAIEFAIKLNPESVFIVGFAGTRLDHTYANIHLLRALTLNNINARLVDSNNTIRHFICDGCHSKEIIVDIDREYKYFSIFPYFESAEISVIGAKYPLSRRVIEKTSTLCVSNEAYDGAKLILHSGEVLLIASND